MRWRTPRWDIACRDGGLVGNKLANTAGSILARQYSARQGMHGARQIKSELVLILQFVQCRMKTLQLSHKIACNVATVNDLITQAIEI